MPVPDRPVSGALIEAEWGQEVHDDVFAPKGARASGTTSSVGTTPVQLDLSTGFDDPGGWLDAANDRLVVPSGADGLYIGVCVANTVNGTADDTDTRIVVYVNGAQRWSAIAPNQGGTNVRVPCVIIGDLAASDVVTVTAQRRGTGSNPTVNVVDLTLLRHGREIGA